MIQLTILILFLSRVIAEQELAVHVGGGKAAADSIAERNQMRNMGQVLPDSNYFLFSTKNNTRYKRSINDPRRVLAMDPGVHWVELQEHKHREKRDKVDDGYLKEKRVVNKSTERQVHI